MTGVEGSLCLFFFLNYNWSELFCKMSLSKTDSFYLSIGVNPRTQNKDSPEDSVSTSPDPSKRGRLMEEGGGVRWMVRALWGSKREPPCGGRTAWTFMSQVWEGSVVRESL